ncbi:MAG TPA: acyltransferase [Acidobacteriaceae bacterium]|jgi:peptidoglycan/LPS O-acetylase OafA/YrhL|nr:acyltransferase [Acidobacteriaceae bacterium]
MKSSLPVLRELDVRDSTILKGLAIIAIVLHNFFHFVSPARQNEFAFHPGSFQIFLREASHPSLAIQAFFSFFGHFGVQIFVFLSAFGLAKSHWDDEPSWSAFMASRIRKLYPMFLLIIIPWVFSTAVWMGPSRLANEVIPNVTATVLGVSTLVGFTLPPVGPWWFIPFIMQFYAIWLVLRWIGHRFGWKGLVALAAGCLVLTQLADPLLARWSINLTTTPIGRMPGICFGIIAARYPVRISGAVATVGLASLILGSLYGAIFPLTFIGVLIASLWLYVQFRNVLRNSRLLERIGECSMLIFLLNAIVRNRLVGYASSPASQLFWGFLSAAISIAISNLLARLLEPQRAPAFAPAEFAARPATDRSAIA